MDKKEESRREANFIMLIRRLIIIAFIVLSFFLIKTKLAEVSWMFVVLIIFWLLTTFPFEFFLKKLKTEKAIENANFFYFIFESSILTACIHYLGGVSWWGGIFYSLTITFAHFMLPRRRSIDLTLIIVFIMFNGLAVLEFFGILPFVPLFGKSPQNNFLYIVVTVFLIDVFLMILAGVLGFFSQALKNKKEEIELSANKIEEEKIGLEIKVDARTKEIKELASGLEYKVEERTGNLKKRIKELENFSGLTKGREEKLIELEKEAERLKTALEIQKTKKV